jgi:hypothetical protein
MGITHESNGGGVHVSPEVAAAWDATLGRK